jgi:hypothetical protein
MKFTFKTDKVAERYGAFYPDIHHIKYNKKEVGCISDNGGFRIRLKVVKKDINEDKNPNCLWKWITLKQTFNSLQESKEWLNAHVEDILKTFVLMQED